MAITTITSSTIPANNIYVVSGQTTSWTNFGWANGPITWDYNDYSPPERCPWFRGPKSKIQCEIPEAVPHETHMGRGRIGQWFSWKDAVYET